MSQFQRQPPELFYRKTCSWKFCNIHRKTPVLQSPFNRLAGFKTCNFLKRDSKGFPVNIAKNLINTYFDDNLRATINISSWVLVSALNSIGLLQRSSSRFKEFSLGCLVVGSSLIWKKRKISRDGHSFSFVVTRCTTRLSVVVSSYLCQYRYNLCYNLC